MEGNEMTDETEATTDERPDDPQDQIDEAQRNLDDIERVRKLAGHRLSLERKFADVMNDLELTEFRKIRSIVHGALDNAKIG